MASHQPPDVGPLGLYLVTDPPNPTADIIFVHGLGGTAFRTWSWQRNPDNFWPQWLAHDDHTRSCRIFTFGYNPNFKGEARGLDAYILGRQDERFASVISSVVGIIFLATPHHGSQYARTLKNVLAAAPIRAPPKSYVSALERQSPVIQIINDVFKRQCDDLELVSFYETLPIKLGFMRLFPVEKNSAVLGYENEISASMDADHNSISKYKDEHDPNYIKLKDTMTNMLQKASTSYLKKANAETFKKVQEILGISDFTRSDGYKQHILTDSGTWLSLEEGFALWLDATTSAVDPRFYWLFGLPGSGKSVLSNIIIDQLQGRDQHPQFHFFSETHQTKRTIAYGIRSIAAQLASRDDSFRKALLALHVDTGFSFDDQNQNFHSIWEKVFEGIIFQLHFPKPLLWVFDGIDESDAPDVLLAHFSRMRSQTPIKIFLSSRPLKAISLFESAQIRSHFLCKDDTAEDMRKYTSSIVQEALPNDDELLRDIVNQTMEHSSGSFLWVKLALEALRESWHTRDDIWVVLTEIPGGMVPMYNRMAHQVESQIPRNREMARRILTLATCSWRPLRLDELQTALEPEFNSFTNLEDTITQICANFVNITPLAGSNKQVSLIHKTARDFLSEGDPKRARVPPVISPQSGHLYLALVCMRYLSRKHWRRHFHTIHVTTHSSTPVRKTSNRLLLGEERYPLLGYAAYYWSYHVSQAPVDAPELLQTLKTFFSKYLLSWLEAICLFGNLQHLIHSAQYLKTYVNRHRRFPPEQPLSTADSPQHDVAWRQDWATDIIRIVGKFGSVLLYDPPSVYRRLPLFCPKDSVLGQTYAVSGPESLTVTGLKAQVWDDCLASVSVDEDGGASQVLATETCFITLASTTGTFIVWSVETCEKLRTIHVGGYVPLMALNKAGTAVVALGSYSVWDLLSGRQLYLCARPKDALVLDLRFGSADWELFVALENNKITRVSVETGESHEHTLPLPVDSDFSYYGCPWRMAFSPDLTMIAAAWRGRPPLVWDILPTGPVQRPRKCLVSDSLDSVCGPELLRWHPDAEVLYVLCQDMKIVAWHVLDGNRKEWEHTNARDMVISDDGRSFLSSDSAGTLSVWDLPRMNLIYSLVNSDSGLNDGLAFSPRAHRFYDLRRSVCNVWEPDALVRAYEQHVEDGSSVEETAMVPKPTISHFDAGGQIITALALDSRHRYYCCGREDGKVWIHDAQSGERLRKVYAHMASTTVTGVVWSESGKYMASCDDGGFIIVKRLRVKEEGTWAVFPVFERRLDERAVQFLFSAGEQYLFISTPRAGYVWDLKAKDEVKKQAWEDGRSGRWIQHPKQTEILVWISPSETRCYEWETLERIGESSSTSSDPLSTPIPPDGLQSPLPLRSTPHRDGDFNRWVSRVAVTADRRFIIYEIIDARSLTHSGLNIESVDDINVSHSNEASRSSRALCVLGVEEQIKYFLGLYKTSVVFLDDDCWVCTWDMLDETGQVVRHFFVPKDWIHTGMSRMAVVNDQGSLFCPRYGEVAIVRNGIRI
ncbi:NACHT and WD domain-containing protein, variant [Chaetomium tenue]|uniref:NACHT and WD domain-containing protein, variant n=1 Tax=Chaetomium tenue TaxID=1854479 RepID=A0ACB7PF37_9PEZI|nr:NACHT and WD domain-containing protein, variant [Chaetomium globosum]